MIFIVGLNEVLDDGARLPESEVRVWVVRGGQAAVVVDGDV